MASVSVNNPSTGSSRIVRNSFPNEQQVWTLMADDIISEVVHGGSPLMQWIPSRGVNVFNFNAAHFSWVAGQDFDGSQTYLEYITEDFEVVADPGECEYGEAGSDFQVTEYSHALHRVTVSNKNNPLNMFDFGGMKQWEKQPMHRFRGPNIGLQIDNDAEWVLSTLGLELETHLNWNLFEGNADIPSNRGMYDGLNKVITTGWVNSHIVGQGSADYSDPIIESGASLTTPEAVLRRIRYIFFKIYNRMRIRNAPPSGDDVVVVMPSPMWRKIAEVMATGVLNKFVTSDVQLNNSIQAVREEYLRITDTSFLQAGNEPAMFNGFIPFHGYDLPVITDDNLGVNSHLENGSPAVTGDIYILTKRFRGQNVLEHFYLDWNNIPAAKNPPAGNSTVLQNGMLRASWVEVNSLCFYYGIEMYGAIFPHMQTLQGRILDVTLQVDYENEIEGANYSHPNFYAYGNEVGGGGSALLVPYN